MSWLEWFVATRGLRLYFMFTFIVNFSSAAAPLTISLPPVDSGMLLGSSSCLPQALRLSSAAAHSSRARILLQCLLIGFFSLVQNDLNGYALP